MLKRYHYEYIPERGEDHQYRVADDQDEVVVSFPTEDQAKRFVRQNNKERRRQQPKEWKF